MFRLLSAEWYKLRKSKSFYICAAVMISFGILLYGMISVADSIQKGELENGTAGVIITKNGEKVEENTGSIWDEMGVFDVLQQVFSGDLVACVLAVYVSVAVISEYSCGMIKNTVGKGKTRAVIFLSKLLTASAASVVITLIGEVTVLIGGYFFIGNDAFAGDFWHNLLVYSGLQVLLTAALAAVYVLTSEITRNMAAGISMGIGVATLPMLLLTGVDMMCEKNGFAPSQYWLVSRSASCPLGDFTTEYIVETALVAVVWFFAAAGFGVWHFCRTDVK